jgi:8-oxo-dGTP pyrophosphatase MutT (NUDIX family)
VREVAEETGLAIDIVRVVGVAESEAPDRKIAYLVFEAGAQALDVRLSSEHDSFEWVPPSFLAGYNFCSQFESLISDFSRCEKDTTNR